MKLNYRKIPENLGGAALPDCGTIHIGELAGTLAQLTLDIGYPVDLEKRVTGSTGKREYSGDIDLVLDTSDNFLGFDEFYKFLISRFGKDSVRKIGKAIHLRYKIVGYNTDHDKYKPRNGFVQVDFNYGEYDWSKFFYYTSLKSAYKSVHRNIAISSVAAIVDRKESVDCDDMGRSVEVSRWKWNNRGLSRVIRKSVPKATGGYIAKQQDTVISEYYTDPRDIVSKLFPSCSTASVLDSLESILEAVQEYHDHNTVQRIYDQISASILEKDPHREFIYPSVIEDRIESLEKRIMESVLDSSKGTQL